MHLKAAKLGILELHDTIRGHGRGNMTVATVTTSATTPTSTIAAGTSAIRGRGGFAKRGRGRKRGAFKLDNRTTTVKIDNLPIKLHDDNTLRANFIKAVVLLTCFISVIGPYAYNNSYNMNIFNCSFYSFVSYSKTK